jgi:hypothetical protein
LARSISRKKQVWDQFLNQEKLFILTGESNLTLQFPEYESARQEYKEPKNQVQPEKLVLANNEPEGNLHFDPDTSAKDSDQEIPEP